MPQIEEYKEISHSVTLTDTTLTDTGTAIELRASCPWITLGVKNDSTLATTPRALSAFKILVQAYKDSAWTEYTWNGTNNLETTAATVTESASIRIGGVYAVKFQAQLAGSPAGSQTITVKGRAHRIG